MQMYKDTHSQKELAHWTVHVTVQNYMHVILAAD